MKAVQRTLDEFEEALRRHKGKISAVAKEFGYTWQGVWQRIQRSERLQQVINECRLQRYETIVDIAEEKCFALVRKGDWAAIKYVLSTHGARRGWQEQQSLRIDQQSRAEIVVDLVPVVLPTRPEGTDAD